MQSNHLVFCLLITMSGCSLDFKDKRTNQSSESGSKATQPIQDVEDSELQKTAYKNTFGITDQNKSNTCSNDDFDKAGDPSYKPSPFSPQLKNRNPTLLFDESHNNIYSISKQTSGLLGKFSAFGDLARAEGFDVATTSNKISSISELKNVDLLVIAGAVSDGQHFLPGSRSWNPDIGNPAFGSNEIESIYQYVMSGGNLLLAMNHAPLTDPYRDLVAKFGVTTRDSTVLNLAPVNTQGWGQILTDLISGSLTTGINVFYSGGGAAMEHKYGKALVKYPTSFVAYGENLPFTPNTPIHWKIGSGLTNVLLIDMASATGKQSAGKVVIFSHAGDITSQQEYCKGQPFNGPQQNLVGNQRLVLNVLRWLVN